MSFWDSLKPVKRPPTAVKVDVSTDKQQLHFDWDDGAHTTASARQLRQQCPCAECVEEWSGRRTFELTSIPEGMQVIDVAPVGNYALCFTFGDNHKTGLFTWELVRTLSTPK